MDRKSTSNKFHNTLAGSSFLNVRICHFSLFFYNFDKVATFGIAGHMKPDEQRHSTHVFSLQDADCEL